MIMAMLISQEADANLDGSRRRSHLGTTAGAIGGRLAPRRRGVCGQAHRSSAGEPGAGFGRGWVAEYELIFAGFRALVTDLTDVRFRP
jgi:hypothetical protein